MRGSIKTILSILLCAVAFLAVGCSTNSTFVTPKTPLSYSDSVDIQMELADQVAVTGQFQDHPFRLVGYALYPIGAALDYLVLKPSYFVASLAPPIFGYTIEDALQIKHHSARSAH